jgi:hypothetical protein
MAADSKARKREAVHEESIAETARREKKFSHG